MGTFFITGASGLLGGQALSRMLRERPGLRAFALVRDPARWARRAAELRLPTDRVEPLLGDVRQPGLGLDAVTRRRLSREVSGTIHLAADIVFSRPLHHARATNLEGTRNLLELSAGWAGPLTFVSTAFVAGRRTGRILEVESPPEAGWVNAYEQSKWEAEQVVRQSGRGALILRSSTVVCDSEGGEVSQLNAVHRALRLFHSGLAPMLPGRYESPVDLVPADYVSGAVARLALEEEAAGETLHLCAGSGAIGLGELLELTREVWSRDPSWARRGISLPAPAEPRLYRLFEEAVEESADPRLRQVVRSLSFFVPQLALEKRFDTSAADRALGAPAPEVRGFWPRMVDSLCRSWRTPGPAAASAAA
jgi:thioester reductase-like protein